MRIILCVTNDMATDRRVSRIASSLVKLPAHVLVIGRDQGKQVPPVDHPFQIIRMKMLINKGPFFYAAFNIRLFFLLLCTKADILVANDLDTLPAVYLASLIKRSVMVYDSHEYFTEVPELVSRTWVKMFWERLESLILPRVKYSYTVSNSIANEYHQLYGIEMRVFRNLPYRIEKGTRSVYSSKKPQEKIIIYQGSLNMGRGLELAIKAMKFISNARLVIAGTGDVESELRELAGSLALHDKVEFTGRVSPENMLQYTRRADLGISLEEKLGLNYYYALPNKLFDYIQARIPVLVSDLPEMSAIVNRYGIGRVLHTRDAYELALVISEMLTDQSNGLTWRNNLEKAAQELCWENEEVLMLEFYRQVISESRYTAAQ
jgi:glycosyltransferase involved in cell wall biosynthesis